MVIVPLSVSDPATVVIVPVAVESEGTVSPIAATLCCKTATAFGSTEGMDAIVVVGGVCATAAWMMNPRQITRTEGRARGNRFIQPPETWKSLGVYIRTTTYMSSEY
jgi:hypothetical protein